MDNTYSCSSDVIRKSFEKRGITKTAIEKMIASIKSSTLRQYEKPLKLWSKFCEQNKICPFSADSSKVIEFLELSYHNISHYGTINSYRSAIALITDKENGKDPYVKRYCKEVSNLKPQTSRYNCTWDPKDVLSYLEKLYPNETLSLDQLTKKFVTLLALITGQRVQTFSVVKLKNIQFEKNEAKIFIDEKIKTSAINKL